MNWAGATECISGKRCNLQQILLLPLRWRILVSQKRKLQRRFLHQGFPLNLQVHRQIGKVNHHGREGDGDAPPVQFRALWHCSICRLDENFQVTVYFRQLQLWLQVAYFYNLFAHMGSVDSYFLIISVGASCGLSIPYSSGHGGLICNYIFRIASSVRHHYSIFRVDPSWPCVWHLFWWNFNTNGRLEAFGFVAGGPWLHLPGVIPGGEPGLRFSSMHCPTWASTTNQTVVSKKDALADVSRCPRFVWLVVWVLIYVLVVGSALYRCPGSRPEEQSVN